MSVSSISSLLSPAIPVAGQAQNTPKPAAQNAAPAAAKPAGGDSDGDSDGSGGGAVNITPPVSIKA